MPPIQREFHIGTVLIDPSYCQTEIGAEMCIPGTIERVVVNIGSDILPEASCLYEMQTLVQASGTLIVEGYLKAEHLPATSFEIGVEKRVHRLVSETLPDPRRAKAETKMGGLCGRIDLAELE